MPKVVGLVWFGFWHQRGLIRKRSVGLPPLLQCHVMGETDHLNHRGALWITDHFVGRTGKVRV